MLQWARGQGCPWNAYTCMYAARGGHLSTLQWAHVQGCPWDANTCSFAAREGHLSMLQWLREHGCPLNAARVRAYARNHPEVLRWLDEIEQHE